MLKKVEAASPTIDGAARVPLTLPLAPTQDFARAILGSVGPATAEIIAKSNGTLTASDLVDISGAARARYDAQARSTRHPGRGGVDIRGRGHRGSNPVHRAGGGRHTAAHDTGPEHPVRRRSGYAPRPRPHLSRSGRRPGDPRGGERPGERGLNLATDGRGSPRLDAKIISSLALLRIRA